MEQAVAALWELHHRGEYQGALDQTTPWLALYPDNRDLRLIEASCLRFIGRTDDALARLDALAALQPGYSLMHQERGLCHVARRDAPAAIEAFLAAVNINPALPQSWKMLEGVWRLVGDQENAAIAAQHGATLRGLPPQVVRATALEADGETALAEALIRDFLLRHGDHPEAMRLLARIGFKAAVYDDAETLYAGVLALAPEHQAARLEYVQTLIARHKYLAAEAALAPLLARDPASSVYRIEAASIATGLGRHHDAIAIYDALLAEAPDARARADLNLWLGHALKTVGDTSRAIEAYRAAARARAEFGDAWWSLANLKTYRFTGEEVAAMRAAVGDAAGIEAVQLNFALAKALEDQGDVAAAWEFYAHGNGLHRQASRYRPEALETNTAEQKRVCSVSFFAGRVGWGSPARDPIFIVGLPRSGSTLIEQILASHSQVEGTQELPDIQQIVHELSGRAVDEDRPLYPASLEGLAQDDVRALGERYLATTRGYRLAGRPFFIDKMPNNFRHIGLIHLILPNARIIDARREPMACCFSNLKQLFAKGQEFTYSIEDIARYYRTYLDLMRHWDAVLPGRVLRVLHEDVVDDLEGQVRRLLDYCELPFEDACLEFHKTERPVRTASSEQVRRPIFREGQDQWRAFEPWLTPLKDALGEALETYRN